MKGKSFSRNYASKREEREAMPLERLLEKRNSSLENWVRENGIYSVSHAEERAKIQGLMITYSTLTKLESLFEAKATGVAAEKPIPQPVGQEESKKRKAKETVDSVPDSKPVAAEE
jgi:hypothetical protein